MLEGVVKQFLITDSKVVVHDGHEIYEIPIENLSGEAIILGELGIVDPPEALVAEI